MSFGVSLAFFFILLTPIFLCGARRGRKKATDNHIMIHSHDLHSQGIKAGITLMHTQNINFNNRLMFPIQVVFMNTSSPYQNQ